MRREPAQRENWRSIPNMPEVPPSRGLSVAYTDESGGMYTSSVVARRVGYGVVCLDSLEPLRVPLELQSMWGHSQGLCRRRTLASSWRARVSWIRCVCILTQVLPTQSCALTAPMFGRVVISEGSRRRRLAAVGMFGSAFGIALACSGAELSLPRLHRTRTSFKRALFSAPPWIGLAMLWLTR